MGIREEVYAQLTGAGGPFEIVEFIAAGGMGELYRARDGRLGREIAIKIRIRRLVWQLPYPKARSGRPI